MNFLRFFLYSIVCFFGNIFAGKKATKNPTVISYPKCSKTCFPERIYGKSLMHLIHLERKFIPENFFAIFKLRFVCLNKQKKWCLLPRLVINKITPELIYFILPEKFFNGGFAYKAWAGDDSKNEYDIEGNYFNSGEFRN